MRKQTWGGKRRWRRVTRRALLVVGGGLACLVALGPVAFGGMGGAECDAWAKVVQRTPYEVFTGEVAWDWEPADPHDPNFGIRCDRRACDQECAQAAAISSWSPGSGFLLQVGCACPGGSGTEGCTLTALGGWNPLGPAGLQVVFHGYLCGGDCDEGECWTDNRGAAAGSGHATQLGCKCD